MSDIVYEKFGFSTPFLPGYRVLKIPIVDASGIPTWPELFPIERIDALRIAVGARHFSSQMMLDFIPPDRARLDPVSLRLYSDDFDARTARIGDNLITGAAAYWDPSLAAKKSDGSVCVLIYRDDKNRRVFIHDVMYLVVGEGELHPMGCQCELVLDFMSRHGLRRIAIETNGIGNALPEIMRDTARRRGDTIAVERVVNFRNKETRILDAIEPVLSTGRLYAHTTIQRTPLLAEMLGWTPIGGGAHDDGLDAVAGAMTLTPMPVRPLGAGVRTYSANTNFNL